MSAAGRIRVAAALVRRVARAATPGVWLSIPALDGLPAGVVAGHVVVVDADERTADAAYVAMMQPALALALADWLDACADTAESLPLGSGQPSFALAIANEVLDERPKAEAAAPPKWADLYGIDPDYCDGKPVEVRPLPVHRTEAGYPRCATCDGGGCLDCTDPA